MKKFYALLFVCVLAVGLFNTKAFAYRLFETYWPTPTSLKYYISQSVYNEGHHTYAHYGAKAWNSSAAIQVYESTSTTNDGTKTSIYSSDEVDLGGYVAAARRYDINGNLLGNGYRTKVWKGTITINDPDFSRQTSLHKYETMTHEMGHILGLDHEDYIPAIMESNEWMDTTNPMTDDWNGINAIY